MNVTATLRGIRAGTGNTSPPSLFNIIPDWNFCLVILMMIIWAFYGYSSVKLKHQQLWKKQKLCLSGSLKAL